jgi:predicted SAM-dependent methyltransferase
MFKKVTRLTKEYLLKRKINRLLSEKSSKVQVGSGSDLMDGYINIDSSPDVGADLVFDISEFRHFPDCSVERIESYHFLEHLDYFLARRTLQHFFRALVPGGMVILELPNLDVCIHSLGKYRAQDGIDLAMVGIYGYPPDVMHGGLPYVHKWGWTFDTLSNVLVEIGFIDICCHDIRQGYREAAHFDRDMQIRATKPGNQND